MTKLETVRSLPVSKAYRRATHHYRDESMMTETAIMPEVDVGRNVFSRPTWKPKMGPLAPQV